MATIQLGGNRGGLTIIDDEVLAAMPEIAEASWHVGTVGYVRGRFANEVQMLHRIIAASFLGSLDGRVIDHISGEKLDNRLANLRICFQRENARNVPMKRNNTSGVVGVSWDSNRSKWLANIKMNRKFINLGWHSTIEAAALARKRGEERYFGEFAYRVNPRVEVEIESLGEQGRLV